MGKQLIIGSNGQVGTELLSALRAKYGKENIIASDLKEPKSPIEGPFHILDAMDKTAIHAIVKENDVDTIYLMAAMLSATAEKMPDKAWGLNMTSLFITLDLAKEGLIKKLFWPSTIAVFGPNSEHVMTPQHGILEPTTVYGISKLAGEQWCAYYQRRYGVDVRTLRYPGLIGYKSAPGGGTTDYAVDIFTKAVHEGQFTCFLSAERTLPMMYMDDAIAATLQLMDAPKEQLKTYVPYNLASLSFSPEQLAKEIKVLIPNFQISYEPDFRDEIAASWPESIDDSAARADWNWSPKTNLSSMVALMLEGNKSLSKV
ncbi:MAG: NAD-dependent epimerase/dehydratase family protein [Bacteroidetes bacterium]|jgi:nucleoside-diphosphate-sugar epimerase|nr:NAD-dependent epimerase/dehydratase family protein [Bacteroidota bacterium]MDA0972582.1 NAD-dependent epimerase/dehydratase family protein [Bacteroidota bacterium]